MRIPVATVVAMVADGMTTTKIIAELPDLTPEDVREACNTRRRPSGSVSCRCGTRHEVPHRQQPLPHPADLLKAAGHDATHIRDYGLEVATDPVVLARAHNEDCVLVSADTDVGTRRREDERR
jgi:hypothetical protein